VHGISVSGLKMDVEKMLARKSTIVSQLTGGIAGLFAGNGVVSIKGSGKLLSGKRVEVTALDGTQSIYEANNVILATGSVPINIPPAPLDGETIVDSTGALNFSSIRNAWVLLVPVLLVWSWAQCGHVWALK
jgi:dihydrolipoamide dehydrogenase